MVRKTIQKSVSVTPKRPNERSRYAFRLCRKPPKTKPHFTHFHHLYELMGAGRSFKSAFYISGFQFSFTTVFGAYSAYLFLRTGHFFAPLVAHIFCNHLGFPHFHAAFQFPPWPRFIILCNFVLGLILWCYLLVPLTEPYIYDNRLQLLT